jgi:hypothetical protein
VLKRNVEQGGEVFYCPRRRIPDCGNERMYFEQEFSLAFAHWRQVSLLGPGFVDGKGELMVLVFELSPLLMQHSDRGVWAFSHYRFRSQSRSTLISRSLEPFLQLCILKLDD